MGVVNRAGNVVNQLAALLHRIAVRTDLAGITGLASMADKASVALTVAP